MLNSESSTHTQKKAHRVLLWRGRWHGILALILLAFVLPAIAGHGGLEHSGSSTSEQQGDYSPPLSGGASVVNSLGFSLGDSSDNPYGEFLDPELAFVPILDVKDANTIIARWEIADDYYLYRDKFHFRLVEPAGSALGEPGFTPGKVKEDEFFGRVEVYYQRAEVTIPVERGASVGTDLSLEVGYQGCADAGLCYPPMTKTLLVSLPAASDSGNVPPVGSASADLNIQPGDTNQSSSRTISEQDRIAGTLAAGTLWITVATFFGFGLLLSFTPCVLPMVPIISGIIAGQGPHVTTRRAFLLSLTFVLAMAAAYTAAGVAAGLTGANLQAVFQAPWILVSFSVLFVLLALSMFGVYELQLPANWQTRLALWSNRQRGGTYLGVAAMGLLAALIVGPCVAAPLAGALIYIGQSGDAALGGMALFAMGLGMGAPILAIGASAGKLLPKSGAWMIKVKAAFGFLLLGVAIYMLERLIPGWVALFLWGALLIYGAIYLGALDSLSESAQGWRRLAKGTGIVVLTYGVLLMLGGAVGGDDVFRPLRGVGFTSNDQARSPSLQFKRIKGIDELTVELERASLAKRTVMLDFYADWCITCKELEKYTFSDPNVQSVLRDTVLLQTDVTDNDELDRALLERLGIYGPPAILFFGPDGRERSAYRLVGYMDAQLFYEHAKAALPG
jgi:thiol:disulfide interchange protein DsbD